MEAEKQCANLIFLYAEDDSEDTMLMNEAMEEGEMEDKLKIVDDGEALMNYLQNKEEYQNPDQAPKPDVILLDLNLPKKDGREALKQIKKDPHLKHIPVIAITTSKSEEDIKKAYQLGANAFVTKPVSFQSLVETMKSMKRFWGEVSELPSTKKME